MLASFTSWFNIRHMRQALRFLSLSTAIVLGCGGQATAPTLDDWQPGAGGDAGNGTVIDAAAGDSTDAPSSPPPSCASGAPGAGPNCGVSQDDDCCASLDVPGGSFYRYYDGVSAGATEKLYPATVSTFRLDKYEVTVGRFRAFVEAYTGPPSPGTGAHPNIPESGWQAQWPMAADSTSLANGLAGNNLGCNKPSWTSDTGLNEKLPINCLTWYEAFAFCAWDGGSLPTEAELLYANAGGAEQRVYPWSIPPASTTVDESHAVYWNGEGGPSGQDQTYPDSVGSRPAGAGKWGQLDLGGNVEEMFLDIATSMGPPTPCNDCARVDSGTPAAHGMHGGAFAADESYLMSASLSFSLGADQRLGWAGVRCARRP